MAVNKAKVMQKVQQLMRKSQWDKALDEMKKIYDEEKSDPMISLRMGDLFLKIGDKKKAAMSYYKTAGLFADSGYTAKAIATYKMILRIEPNYEDVEQRIDKLAKEKASTAKTSVKQADSPKASSGSTEPSDTIELSQLPDTEAVIEQGSYADYGNMLPDDASPEPSGVYGNIELSGAVSEGNAAGLDEGTVGGAGLELETGGYEEYAADSADDITHLLETGYAPSQDAMEEAPKEDAVHSTEDVANDADSGPSDADDSAEPIPLFSHMPVEELRDMLDRMEQKSYDTGEVIVREGEEGASLFIIKSGGVRVVTRVKGMVLQLAELAERDFFGEVSFLTGRPRTADIMATGPTDILELSGDELGKVVAKYPEIEDTLRMFHENRVSETLASFKAVSKEMFL